MGWSCAEVVRTTADDSGTAPSVDFIADAECCPVCGGVLHVHKSKRRFVATLEIGAFQAREIRKVCSVDRSHPVMASERLARLVPRGQGYGYDLIVQVGLARYLRNLQREEIRAELLREHGIVVSEGTITTLCDRFLKYLERLHRHCIPVLRTAMAGGYPLHIDATNEHGKGGLFLCMDGWRGWVLHAVKISSENEDELRPAIEKAVALFGDPIAVVRDLSAAEAKALGNLRDKGIPDLVCHYHFLGAIGKKLFDDHYVVLRNLLRSSKVRTGLRDLLRELRQNSTAEVYHGKYGQGRLREDLLALILWILEGEGGKDLPYPFCLPHLSFYQRCIDAMQRAERWLPLPRSHIERRALKQLSNVIARLEAQRQRWLAPKLERGWQAFCELRDILRLSDAELPRGDLRYHSTRDFPEMEMARLCNIEKKTMAYREQIRERVVDCPSNTCFPETIILNYLDRYADNLFGHPARFDEDGKIIAVVERTNNVAEHFFGADKQKLRRRLGRANLGRDLEDQPAQAVLASNLRHPDYVRLLSGSLENLPTAFAKLDREQYREGSPLQRSNKDTNLLRRIRVLVGDEQTRENNGTTNQQIRQSEASPTEI